MSRRESFGRAAKGIVPGRVRQRYGPRWTGLRAQIQAYAEKHRSITIIVSFAIAGVLVAILPHLPPLTLLQTENPWYDAFANAGVFMLLAMGLNVVVGLSGLLDLGYAAFFAIGA